LIPPYKPGSKNGVSPVLVVVPTLCACHKGCEPPYKRLLVCNRGGISPKNIKCTFTSTNSKPLGGPTPVCLHCAPPRSPVEGIPPKPYPWPPLHPGPLLMEEPTFETAVLQLPLRHFLRSLHNPPGPTVLPPPITFSSPTPPRFLAAISVVDILTRFSPLLFLILCFCSFAIGY